MALVSLIIPQLRNRWFIRGDDEPAEEAAYEVCQMCGQERLRFVHVMQHDLERLCGFARAMIV